TLFAFGAKDELDTRSPTADPNDPSPPLSPALVLGFHRLDLRYQAGAGKVDSAFRVVAGLDHTISAGTDVSMRLVEPAVRVRIQASRELELVAGVEGALHDTDQG